MSVAGHVGRTLLAAHRAGKIGPEAIEPLVELVLRAPRVGQGCVGYSTLEKDARECVNNVNQAAGWFLTEALAAGIGDERARRLAADITQRQVANYRPEWGGWRYIEERDEPNDFNHEASSIESALRLSPPVGFDAGARFMVRRDYEGWVDPLGQVRLLPFFPEHAGAQLPAFAYMLEDDRQSAQLMAQCALWAARAARRLRGADG